MHNRKKLIALLPFLVIIGIGTGLWKSGISRDNSFELADYTVPAERGTLPGIIKSSGEIQAIRRVNLSPERQGLLVALYVQEGDTVKEGELIAKMDEGDYQYRLNKVKADYEKEISAFHRRKILLREGAISTDQYEEFLNRFKASEAIFNQIKIEKDKFEIRAPFNGVVTKRFSEPGAFVAPATRMSSIAGSSSSSSIVELSQGLEVLVKVPESDIGRIRINQYAFLRADAFPDKRFKARVVKIAPRASQEDNVTSFDVTLVLINQNSLLKIGMNTDVEFQAGETDISTLVPTVAIVTENGNPGVLVLGKNNNPTFKKVELGTSSGDRTAIISGIESGDLIFIDLPPGTRRNSD